MLLGEKLLIWYLVPWVQDMEKVFEAFVLSNTVRLDVFTNKEGYSAIYRLCTCGAVSQQSMEKVFNASLTALRRSRHI